ncbi:MAG: tetratricopeptide repeat protein, partial [Telluria sp.]
NGQVEESERLSAMGLAHGARPTDALVVAASLALGRTDTEVAIKLFNEVLAKNPTEGRSWSGLGLASMLNRDLPAASQQLEQAVKYMPDHVGTLHTLGWCKILSQDLDGARGVFLKTIDMDRNFGDSHGGLAVVLAMKGERDLAEESIKRALGLDPQSLSARFAQMVLAGKVDDPVKFRALAGRMLSAYKGPFGASLDVMLDEYEAR